MSASFLQNNAKTFCLTPRLFWQCHPKCKFGSSIAQQADDEETTTSGGASNKSGKKLGKPGMARRKILVINEATAWAMNPKQPKIRSVIIIFFEFVVTLFISIHYK